MFHVEQKNFNIRIIYKIKIRINIFNIKLIL